MDIGLLGISKWFTLAKDNVSEKDVGVSQLATNTTNNWGRDLADASIASTIVFEVCDSFSQICAFSGSDRAKLRGESELCNTVTSQRPTYMLFVDIQVLCVRL